jgi:hypothetical protein
MTTSQLRSTRRANRFLKPQGNAANFSGADALGLEISCKTNRLILSDVRFVEPLPVRIARLDKIIIKQRDCADSFSD